MGAIIIIISLLVQFSSIAVSYTHLDVYKRQAHRCIPRSSKILALNPFLDDTGILTVGGRLQLSPLNYASKHQIILHPHSHLTKLIIEYEHIRSLHAGVQSTQSSLRQKCWIIHKSYIRSVINKCIICFRYRARAVSYTHLDVYKRQVPYFPV